MTTRMIQWMAGLLLVALSATTATGGQTPDEKMELRVDLSQKAFPTLFLRAELPRGWWLASQHEWGNPRYMTGDPHTLALLRRTQALQAGSTDDTVVLGYEVSDQGAADETLATLAETWIDDREAAGWTVNVPLRGMSPRSSLKAGRKKIRLYRGEFAARDNYMVASSTGRSELYVYQVHGFVVGARAVLFVTRKGAALSQILDGLALTIRDKPGKPTRRVKLTARSYGPDATDKRCCTRITFKLPKNARQEFPTAQSAPTTSASKPAVSKPAAGKPAPSDDIGLAGRWTLPGRKPKDSMRIALHAETRPAFDMRRQLTFWMAERTHYALIEEPDERKVDGRETVQCTLRRAEDERTGVVAMHLFTVNGVHWRLSVECAAGSGDKDEAKARKATAAVLKALVTGLHAWTTRPFLQPSTSR